MTCCRRYIVTQMHFVSCGMIAPAVYLRAHGGKVAKVIELLVSKQVLVAPDGDKRFSLHTDASILAAGAVLAAH